MNDHPVHHDGTRDQQSASRHQTAPVNQRTGETVTNRTTDQPPTEQQLDEIETRAAHLYEYATLTDGPLQADADQLTGKDVPALAAEVRRLRPALTEMTHCRDNALRALYRDDVETDIDLEETIAAPFYGPGWDWDESDLKPVVREAADAVRPAFGKLTQERDRLRSELAAEAGQAEATLDRVQRIASRLAAHAVGFGGVLGESDRGPWGRTVGADIAELSAAFSPDAAPTPSIALLAASPASSVSESAQSPTGAAEGALRAPLPADEFTGTQPCGHDDYHDPHPWADRPNVWCPGIGYDDDQAAVEAHIVADDSSDPTGSDAEAHRLALSEALGLGTGAPWDAIRERAAELAGRAGAVDRGAEEASRPTAFESPTPTALRVRVLREIIGRISGTDTGDSATEEVGAAQVLATLKEILADELAAETPGPETQGAVPWLTDSARIGRTLIWSWSDVGKGAFREGYRAAQAEARALLGGERGTDQQQPAVVAESGKEG